MGKIKEKIDGSPTLSRVVAIMSSVVPIAAALLGVFSYTLDQKLTPINNYVSIGVVRSIEKQIYKIENDPDDVKLIDLKNVLDDYSTFLDNKHKTITLETNIKRINNFYIQMGSNRK